MINFWERSDRWNTDQAQTETTADKEASWKDLGSSMNAISFGFVATAILISMFLIMAIFEHLIRPRQSLEQSQNESQVSFGVNRQQYQLQSNGKLVNSKSEVLATTPNLSVLMPGQRFPTFLAQPAPLLPCPREGIYWPSHHQQACDRP
ncbi:uncharacterized protein LOC110097584 [Dendrobium catenatum]|uniref:Uncharacterized protein n=1 Tax=Dendrobium catenatum TaxID=906689 RepID=A0A2I0X286_9ASPA|nr:uncharacterized protein LOC110097584 [Dendrobium catenatum]XP_020679718.1 uncharacterized protein LOC110097584 [Dendrobium catenatum]XP_020679719.1 uncharacterized protein LOC110097584 [Dendrobium catenatum]PKU82007.1 hypothetical protein MA16_Dca004024 [Dendrobium catenatum]